MKDCIGIILVSLFISFLPVSAHTQQDSDMNELIAHAQKFVELAGFGHE
jgi:hypothetical protein